MRSRIVAPLMTLVVAVAVLLVLPSLQTVSRERTNELELQRREVLDRVASLTRLAVETGDAVPLERYLVRHHDLHGESLLVIDTTEQVLAGVGGLDPDDPRVERRTRDSGYNVPFREVEPVLPWSSATAVLSVPVEVSRDVASGVVLLEADLTDARDDVRRGWLGIVVPALLGLLALFWVTLRAARWILRPVHALEAATHALTQQEAPAAVAVGGPPELRRLASSFTTMAGTLSATLAQQRDLVSNTSHQLRNPLAAVRLNVDLLPAPTDADRQRLAAVQADLDRLDHTVDRLLGLAEAEHRVMEARAARLGDAPAEPGATADRVRAHVAARWGGPGGPAVRVTADDDVVLALPAAEVVEVVDALVENAVKYAGPGAHVEVGLRAGAPGRAVLEVADDGDGLTDEELAHARERFWRSSRHVEHPGTGLGLAIVDALARAAGGSMTVARAAAGGLAVRLDLPRDGA
ncbi:sensor histidine kinase [Klenkia taihuensis]|uniref:histidine kinase n=1 Tax=Klenkia taihuensis TaxID=1225127 RepID=A0A1I1M7A9_9ACTN|nr:HAMP domain-containing sensor histidine kinase [Klenkia taihuensis]GHE14119.1 two-component sensor histidine kinase [Klenkia taihuensis]SFC81289.1 Signal transduction histidine kinase [Klenkia taihuensis]